MRVRLKTKAITVYLCTVALTSACVLLIIHFNGRDIESKSRSFDHMAVDRVMLAHEQKGLWVPEDKPALVNLMEKEPHHQRQEDSVKKAKISHLPDVKDLSPTERLTSLSRAKVANLSYADLSELYHSYVMTIQYECHNIVRLGRVTDGGWEICGDEMFVPKSKCLVYSFGVGDDFSFDDAAARNYKCEVHSFDPSMKQSDHERESTVHFHKKGLADFNGETNSGWKVGTLESIKHELGHQERPLAILKMDIEEWEWQVLPEILSTQSLSDVKQFLIELHACETCSVFNPQLIDKEPTKERYIKALNLFKSLYHLGFRIFWSHKNNACKYVSRFGLKERSACHELHMVRVS
ncbi:probable methyltransferase-like protein 24 [Haliotis rufescens]|uniref:probable methyltransferase-like protein 24 n=1 Tax=Haliotis rufescens TaxID=6454 RepID=UPI001EB01FFF|nr:probable methyltransferase-like protein 24 [Haliotis rufescens]